MILFWSNAIISVYSYLVEKQDAYKVFSLDYSDFQGTLSWTMTGNVKYLCTSFQQNYAGTYMQMQLKKLYGIPLIIICPKKMYEDFLMDLL